MNDLTESSAPPRSRFITSLAMISLLVCIVLLVSDVAGLISYLTLTNSAAYQMAIRQISTYMPGARSMLFNSGPMVMSSVVSIILNSASIIASLALVQRKRWGRDSFVWLIWIQTGYYVISAVSGYFLARSFARETGLFGQTLVSGSLMLGGYVALVGVILLLSTAIFLTRKLSSPEVRREFETQAI